MRFVTNITKGILGQPDSVEMWERIVNQIPVDVLMKPCVTILNMAFGHGTEADVLVRRMVSLGRSVEDARRAIWLVEKYTPFVNYAKLRGYEENQIFKEDFLVWAKKPENKNMKFDIIIGNPPYQESNDKYGIGSLWPKFVNTAYDFLRQDGHLAFVTPSAWMAGGPQSPKCFKIGYIKALDSECKRYFPGVGSTFSWYVIQKTAAIGITQIIGEHNFEVDLKSLRFLPTPLTQEACGIVLKLFNRESLGIKMSVGVKPSLGYNGDRSTISKEKDKDHPYEVFHTNAQRLWSSIKSPLRNQHKIMWTLSGNFKPFYDAGELEGTDLTQHFVVDDAEQAKQILTYFESKLIRFVVSDICKYSGFISYRVMCALPKVPFKLWSDADLYDYFNLTQDEIDLIELTIK